MTDLELLFLVLAVIYFWECACWVPRGSVAFVTWFGRRWRPAHPGSLLGNQRGGFVVAPPLPPLGTILVGNQFPVSISPESILAFVSTSVNPAGRPLQSGEFLAFKEIKSVSAQGRRLVINSSTFVRAASSSLAVKFARHVQELGALAADKRQNAIADIINNSLDDKLLARRWAEFQPLVANIRPLTNFLFVWLFVLAPIFIWQFGFRSCWLGLLAGLLLAAIATAILFHRAHKALYPQAEEPRFTHFLTVLLSPATTVRALDILSRPLLEDFHPLAIAKSFCPGMEFRAFAQRMLLELRQPAWPVCPNPTPAAEAVEAHWRGAMLKAVEKFLKRSGLDPADLTRPPAPTDESCLSYCPRCLAQFTALEGSCSDCGGLPLVPFGVSRKNLRESSADHSPSPITKGRAPG